VWGKEEVVTHPFNTPKRDKEYEALSDDALAKRLAGSDAAMNREKGTIRTRTGTPIDNLALSHAYQARRNKHKEDTGKDDHPVREAYKKHRAAGKKAREGSNNVDLLKPRGKN